MKKIYMTPDMEIVKIQTMQMMAASLEIDPTEEVTDESEILAPSLGGDFSFDDETFSFGSEESISSFE